MGNPRTPWIKDSRLATLISESIRRGRTSKRLLDVENQYIMTTRPKSLLDQK